MFTNETCWCVVWCVVCGVVYFRCVGRAGADISLLFWQAHGLRCVHVRLPLPAVTTPGLCDCIDGVQALMRDWRLVFTARCTMLRHRSEEQTTTKIDRDYIDVGVGLYASIDVYHGRGLRVEWPHWWTLGFYFRKGA